MTEAKSTMTRLCESMKQLLASNQDLSRRLRATNDENIVRTTVIESSENDASGAGPSSIALAPDEKVNLKIERKQRGFAFEEELLASPVYNRPLFNNSRESLLTSAATRSTASSILSALSISDVSSISIVAVPIYAHEISNSRRYTFGDFHPKMMKKVELTDSQAPKDAPKKYKWERLGSAVEQRERAKSLGLEKSSTLSFRVFGISLETSISYANVAISVTDEEGPFFYGYIPTIVAKAGVFLKETGEFTWHLVLSLMSCYSDLRSI